MRLKKLPRSGRWEVGVLPPIDHATLGFLMVLDATHRTVRLSEPFTDTDELPTLLRQAATAPIGGSPARPRSLHCRPGLEEVLADAAKALGASLQVTDDLPMLAEVEGGLQAIASQVSAPPPLLPADPGPWPSLVEAFTREAPWRALSDSVQFRFVAGPEPLRGAVGIVLGQAGEQHGLSLFPTQEDYEAFLAAAYDGDRSRPWSCWCAHLDQEAELPRHHVELADHLGLRRDGLVLQLFAFEGGMPRPLDADEERLCAAALQGALAAWSRYGPSLTQLPALVPVSTAAGELRVATVPPAASPFDVLAEEPLILAVDHMVFIAGLRHEGRLVRALVMKMAKRDAERLRDRLYDVDTLSSETTASGETAVVAWAGTERVGVLCRLPPGSLAESVQEVDHLAISAGGARRRSLRGQDVLDVRPVTVRAHGEQPPALGAPAGGMAQASFGDPASWEGPPESWPKASAVLLDFAEPLGVNAMTSAELEMAVTLAAAVWTAVVFADVAGQPQFLRQLLQQGRRDVEGAMYLDQLIERKRTRYPQDTRLMRLDCVTTVGGRADVRVSWRLP